MLTNGAGAIKRTGAEVEILRKHAAATGGSDDRWADPSNAVCHARPALSPMPESVIPGVPNAPPLPPSPPPPPPLVAATPVGVQASQLPASLEEIVRIAHTNGFSDVHLGVGEEPRFRARGEMRATGWPLTELAQFQSWMREILSPVELDQFLHTQDYDGSHAFSFARLRINLFDGLRGAGMVLRLIPQVIPTLDALQMPEVLKTLTTYRKGMVLVTGPTGSGKSTTLAAMIQWINTTQNKHIITIEDPVEFVHTSQRSLIRQREVGRHTAQFSTALRAAMREDPDVILIGEIRDRETLSTVMEAAQTGHLVLGTLHTNSAVKTVERVMGMYPPQEQDNIRQAISESLLAVISQGLLKSKDGKMASFHDILVNNDACRDYIRRAELDEVEQIMARSAFDGMHTINQSLAELVQSGRVAAEAALVMSNRPNELAQILRGRV